MTDWFRRKTWTEKDEEEFFAKLARARKDGRAQYLRIQALELAETKDENLLTVAETLLNRLLAEYPDNRFEKSQTFNQLGGIYKLRNDHNKALEYFKKSLDFEKEFPNKKTLSYLDYSETVIRTEKTELYDEVEALLVEEINRPGLKFPANGYVTYSVLSVISHYKGNLEDARMYSDLAEGNASLRTNTLWNPRKKHLGIVKERKDWLDKLVGRVS